MSIFKKAATTATVKKSKKVETPSIVLTEDIFEGISAKLSRVEELRKQMANLEAESKILEGEIKTIGKSVYTAEYSKLGRRPESFNLEGEKGGKMMFLVSDKYKSIDSVRFSELEEKYGKDIVNKDVEYAFDPIMLSKYEEVLSDLIENSDKIAEDDKASIIIAKPSLSIKKGTLEKLTSFTKREFPLPNGTTEVREFSIDEIFQDIEPVVSLKDVS